MNEELLKLTKLKIIVVVIFSSLTSFSQNRFIEGYIVTAGNDTIKGFIEYRYNDIIYKQCSFKKDINQAAEGYSPADIMGYGFLGDRFFESKLITGRDQKDEAIFLEVLIKGLVNLYRNDDTFFVEKNANIQPLLNETKEEIINGKMIRINSNKYLGILNMFMSDCIALRSRIQKVKLNKESLLDLVEDYNTCKGVSITKGAKRENSVLPLFNNNKPKCRVSFGPKVGIAHNTLKFENNKQYPYFNTPFQSFTGPVVGMSLGLSSPNLTNRFSMQIDFLYWSTRFQNDYRIEGFIIQTSVASIDLQQLKVPLGIRYTLRKNNFAPFFDAGISQAVHLGSSSKLIIHYWAFNEFAGKYLIYKTEESDVMIDKRQFGLWGGCGLLMSAGRKLNFAIEFRYERLNGTSESPTPKSQASNYLLTLALKRK